MDSGIPAPIDDEKEKKINFEWKDSGRLSFGDRK